MAENEEFTTKQPSQKVIASCAGLCDEALQTTSLGLQALCEERIEQEIARSREGGQFLYGNRHRATGLRLDTVRGACHILGRILEATAGRYWSAFGVILRG